MKTNFLKLLSAVLVVSLLFTACEKIDTPKDSTNLQQNIYKDDVYINVEDVINSLCYNPLNIDITRICPANIDPVCACEVITFGNACTAEAYGFQNYTQGSCVEQKCYNEVVKRALHNNLCPAQPNYVCGCNGVTYRNACDARRNGILVSTPGRCEYGTDINIDSLIEKGCFDPRDIEIIGACPLIFAPVCACGVIQFGNGCEAQRAGFQNYEQGSCVENRCKSKAVKRVFRDMGFVCPPGPNVCGCDGVNYNSPCNALVNGVLAWYPGPCGRPGGEITDGVSITITNP